jgi:leucyl aminopeptidase
LRPHDRLAVALEPRLVGAERSELLALPEKTPQRVLESLDRRLGLIWLAHHPLSFHIGTLDSSLRPRAVVFVFSLTRASDTMRRFMEIAVVEGPAEDVEADLLAVPVTDPVRLTEPGTRLDRALGGRLTRLIEDGEMKGGRGHLTLLHTDGAIAARRVAAAGIGRLDKLDSDSVRTAASRVVSRAGAIAGGTVAWALGPDLGLDPAVQAQAIVDGTVLGSFDAGRWKTTDERPKEISRLVLCGEGAGALESVVHRAGIAAKWANRCRELVNAPGNELNPAALADRAGEIAAAASHLSYEALGLDEIREAGMGAILAVAQGSAAEPRLIVLDYEPPGAQAGLHLGLVGKAITFDSGGISIKPSQRMDEMKSDMGGGAAVLCGLAAVAELGLPVRVTAVVPSCENMPSGTATRPGDIVTALNGKTIEITNTDAEGRLVLADALTYARRRGATHLLDFATLTGAVVVALGDYYAGLMGNDDVWTERVRSAAAESGDHAWVLPVHDTYRRLYRSTFADMKNSSDLRQAGPIYAARFLQEFAGDGPWAHLDIAGTAFLDRSREDYYTRKGATGYGVRLIAALATALAAEQDSSE